MDDPESGSSDLADGLPAMTEPRKTNRPPFSDLHDRTIAVQFVVSGQERLLTGRGAHEQDPELGSVLRIRFSSDTDGEILIAEQTWDGEIVPGEEAGGDFLIRLR
jgi:hypothetical protein